MHVIKTVRNSKGFSLVELMVVVAIIGILAAIAIPNFQRFSAKAKTAEATSNLSSLFGSEASFFAEWSVYDQDMLVVGYKPQGYIRYRITNGAFTALPPNYSGPASAAGNDVTSGICGANAINANGCGEVTNGGTGVAAPVTGAPAMTASTFTTTASSILKVGLTADTWSVDNNKTILNPNMALP